MTIQEIQKICMEKFPIGCEYIPTNDVNKYTLISDGNTYKIVDSIIQGHIGGGILYNDRNGKYATLVVNEWSVGTYVAFLQDYGHSETGCIDKIVSKDKVGDIRCEKEGITTKDPDYVRWFATKEEAEKFAIGICPKNEVVHCTTQEEFDFVCEILCYNNYGYPKFNCIQLDEDDKFKLEYCQKEGDKIFTFEQWCTEFDHKFEPAATNIQTNKEWLLEEARRMYPKNTKFKCSNVHGNIRFSLADFFWEGNNLRVKTIIPGEGNMEYSNYVYYNGKWAEILNSVDKQNTTMGEFKEGDEVTIIKWHFTKIRTPQKGIIVVIDRESSEPYGIEIEEDQYDKKQKWFFRDDEFIKREPNTPALSSKFKIGDRVKVITERGTRYGWLNGNVDLDQIDGVKDMVGTIESFINNDGKIYCKLSCHNKGHVCEEFLEKIIFKPSDMEIDIFGLKVGDKLPEVIMNEWEKISGNICTDGTTWSTCNSGFTGDREIESFRVINGVPGFLVSNTLDVYLKAEGFKEFRDKHLYTSGGKSFYENSDITMPIPHNESIQSNQLYEQQNSNKIETSVIKVKPVTIELKERSKSKFL